MEFIYDDTAFPHGWVDTTGRILVDMGEHTQRPDWHIIQVSRMEHYGDGKRPDAMRPWFEVHTALIRDLVATDIIRNLEPVVHTDVVRMRKILDYLSGCYQDPETFDVFHAIVDAAAVRRRLKLPRQLPEDI